MPDRRRLACGGLSVWHILMLRFGLFAYSTWEKVGFGLLTGDSGAHMYN